MGNMDKLGETTLPTALLERPLSLLNEIKLYEGLALHSEKLRDRSVSAGDRCDQVAKKTAKVYEVILGFPPGKRQTILDSLQLRLK